MKLLILIGIFTLSTNLKAQNTVLDHSDYGYKKFIEKGLTALDVDSVVVIIKQVEDLGRTSYNRKIKAKVLYSEKYPNTYLIYLSKYANKFIIAHELIHIWQAHNGNPCIKNIESCEREADIKKDIVLRSVN
jgi:Zn-dependent peptidase ImmA (M78 family)